MGYSVTVFFYLLIGFGVAVSLWLRETAYAKARLFQALTAPLFWPIYVPVLLAGRGSFAAVTDLARTAGSCRSSDEMASMITKVESELDAALLSLNGWANDVLASQQARIIELRTAWRQQADRIRELDRLLVQAANGKPTTPVAAPDSTQAIPAGETVNHGGAPDAKSPSTAQSLEAAETESDSVSRGRIAACERTRQENLIKLKRLRRQMYDDLMTTLAWVRELVTMIHLAKYSGAPASRASELVEQIATAVQGLSNAAIHVAV